MNVQDEAPQTTDLYKAALYYSRFWSVIPLKPRSKVAALQWRFYQDNKPQATELWEWFNEWRINDRHYTEQPNIACILGDFTVQLDYDGLAVDGGLGEWVSAYPLVRELPRTRTGSGRVHVFFRVSAPIQHHDIALPGGGVIEVRTGRNIAVLPPSIHPNGEPYTWEVPIPADGIPLIDPATVGITARPKLTVVGREYHEGDPLSEEEIDAIVGLVAPHWREGTNRHVLSLALPGWLASIGAPEEDARTVVSRLGEGDAGRAAEYQRSVRDTYVKAAASESTQGWSELSRRMTPGDLAQLDRIAKAHEPVFSLTAKTKGVVIPWQIDLADFLALDFPPDAWLVDSLIADIQLGMIAGEPGSSKSWISLYLALCVALGEPLFGTYYVPERKRVVYIQEENSPSKLNRRIARLLKWMGRTRDDIRGWFTLITNQSFRIDKPEVMERLANEVLTPQQPALVIFDPMVEMHWKKENDNDEMAPLMAALRQIRDHYECVVILVHHVNKAVEIENFLYRVRGAGAITGALDFCIGVIRPDQQTEKSTVFWAKVRDDKKPRPFVVELIDNADGSIRFACYEGGENEKPKREPSFPPTLDAIWAKFKEIGPATVKQMMAKFDANPDDHTTYSAASEKVRKLVAKERLEKVTYSTLPGGEGYIYRAK